MKKEFRQAVGDFPEIPLKLESQSTAVLIIDVQNDFCLSDGVYSRNGLACPSIPDMLEPLRSFLVEMKGMGVRLINIRTVYECDESGSPLEAGLHLDSRPFLREEGLRPGSWGAETVDGLSDFDDEIVKVRFSSFFGTSLEALLKHHNIETVVLTGVYTNYCVQATAFDAYQRNFQVVMAHDMMTTWDPDVHRGVLKGLSGFTNVTSAESILSGLKPLSVKS